MKNYVSYLRVSTEKQGKSGLGLEAQKAAVLKFVGTNNIIAEFQENESGKNDNRIELLKAIDYAKNNNATLLIAKLDRLSRNASFILSLQNSKVDFICADMPDANSFTIGIFALLAQQEREMISARTKAALQAKKEQGYKLGSPDNLTNSARERSIEVRISKAVNNENNIKAAALIKSLAAQNNSLRQIAETLNNAGFKTSKNQKFEAMTVKRLLDKISK